MYKVVIIDDEPIILEGITKIVQWEKYQCEVVGTACDGKEGTVLIREQNPDIVITDIAMPEMDGLTMAAGLKSEFPDMQIVILTGYREFEYAQEAIQLGVRRLLLKPSNLEEIEEAIEASCKEICDRKEKQERYPPLETGKKTIKSISGDQQKASSFIVNKALDYINEHYDQKLTLSDVADQIYVSQWHLSKLLNKHLEQNFSGILNGIRIKKAKELLEHSEYRIGDIAEKVGFIDLAHFSRVFKKLEGISANEYRNTIISGLGYKNSFLDNK